MQQVPWFLSPLELSAPAIVGLVFAFCGVYFVNMVWSGLFERPKLSNPSQRAWCVLFGFIGTHGAVLIYRDAFEGVGKAIFDSYWASFGFGAGVGVCSVPLLYVLIETVRQRFPWFLKSYAAATEFIETSGMAQQSAPKQRPKKAPAKKTAKKRPAKRGGAK